MRVQIIHPEFVSNICKETKLNKCREKKSKQYFSPFEVGGAEQCDENWKCFFFEIDWDTENSMLNGFELRFGHILRIHLYDSRLLAQLVVSSFQQGLNKSTAANETI